MNNTQEPAGEVLGAAYCSALAPLPGQPLCKHYTGATLDHLTGDYSCRCLADIPYERWTPDMDRWPCRRRHLLGLEQHECPKKDYGSDLAEDVDEQLTEMTILAISGQNTEMRDGESRVSTTTNTP